MEKGDLLNHMKSSWHVATAAEAIAAGQFARLGFDVSVQYGAAQPEYDLVVAEGEKMLKLSVKGSRTGSWGLTQSYLSEANYHRATDQWLAKFRPKTALCLVQFHGVDFNSMPNVYLALPSEVADRLKAASGGVGDTILFENKTRGSKAKGAGLIEKIPDSWRLSPERAQEILARTV